MRHSINTILDLIFPVNCLGCGKRGKNLCEKCISKIPVAERPTLEWVYPVFDYRDLVVRKAVWLLKYKNKKTIANTMATLMRDSVSETLSELEQIENFKTPIVIPIPLSKKRYHKRGYNQSELLAQELALEFEPIEIRKDLLVRIKDTEHQAKIKERKKRLANAIGAFEVAKTDALKDRNIILIDDVVTTGATLSEAKKVLKKAGARKIIAFTFAH